MATAKDVLDDANIKYRNTFTTQTKINWLNDEHRDVYEVFELDSPPFVITAVADQYFYSIPDGLEIEKIKTASIQINDATPSTFRELPFERNDDRQQVRESDYWYTIVNDDFYINFPSGPVAGRDIYFYADTAAPEITTTNMTETLLLPSKYKEILTLGLLKRIAEARKDSVWAGNYAQEREAKIDEMMWSMKMSQPEYIPPIDMLPRANRYRRGTQDYRYFSS